VTLNDLERRNDPSSFHGDDCLEGKKEYYQNCSLLCCVICTVSKLLQIIGQIFAFDRGQLF